MKRSTGLTWQKIQGSPAWATALSIVAVFMSILEEIFAAEPRDHWVEKLRTAGVPCGPVRNLDEALNSPEVIEAGLVPDNTPSDGRRSTNAQITDWIVRPPDREDTPPPLLGEHTDEVLRSILDLSEDEIAKLRSSEVIA